MQHYMLCYKSQKTKIILNKTALGIVLTENDDRSICHSLIDYVGSQSKINSTVCVNGDEDTCYPVQQCGLIVCF